MLPHELEELKSINQWVCYKKQKRRQDGKFTKIPVDPKTGRYAQTNDPSTWGTYDQAVARVNNVKDVDGIGFVFSPNDHYFGIDLDDVVLADGSLSEIAEEIVKIMDSYTEYSMSGTGLHILCRCTEKRLEGAFGRGKRSGQIEMYMAGRYFVVTGKVFGDPKPVQLRAEQGNMVFLKYLKPNAKNGIPKREGAGPAPLLYESPQRQPAGVKWEPGENDVKNLYRHSDGFRMAVRMTDGELWDTMFKSSNGSNLTALYNGCTVGYRSHSEADLSLVGHLKFWTNGDPERMDRMFRQSGLMRPKWDVVHRGGKTYGQITIDHIMKRR